MTGQPWHSRIEILSTGSAGSQMHVLGNTMVTLNRLWPARTLLGGRTAILIVPLAHAAIVDIFAWCTIKSLFACIVRVCGMIARGFTFNFNCLYLFDVSFHIVSSCPSPKTFTWQTILLVVGLCMRDLLVGFCPHVATGFPQCSIVPFYFDWPEILMSVVLTHKVVWPFCSVQTRENRTDTRAAY